MLDLKQYFRVSSYDTNLNGFPEGIDYQPKHPHVYYMPAYNKAIPYRKYTGSVDVQSLTKFIITNSQFAPQFKKKGINPEKLKNKSESKKCKGEECNQKKDDL